MSHGSMPPQMLEPTLELSILMPCLNEALTLPGCIRKAMAFLAEHHIDGEVVIADNGSTDGSVDLARACGARVVDVPIRGYGAALFVGAVASRGRFIIMGDSDGSYDFGNLSAFVKQLRNGHDLVMGNRFLGGIRPGAMPWKNRYIGNPILSGIGRLFFHSGIGDFHCGLRGFRRDAFTRMNLQTTGMEFASEMVIKATALRMKIAEVPTTLDKDGRDRPPHLRPWRDGWRHLRFMLLYSPNWLFLYPGTALALVGLVLGAILQRGPIELTATSGLDVHSLLFASAAVLLGFQAVGFSFFARIYALNEGLVLEDRTLQRLLKYLSLEIGLAAGALLMLSGLGGALATVYSWSRTHYGALQPQITLRAAIPSVTAMTLGGELIFVSFLLSVLGLGRRRWTVTNRDALPAREDA